MISMWNGKKRRPIEDIEKDITRLRAIGLDQEADEFSAKLDKVRSNQAEYARFRRSDPVKKKIINKQTKAYKEKNLEAINGKRSDKEKENKLRAMALFNNECHDCGKIYPPAAMDLHHINPAKKKMNLAGSMLMCKWSTIEEEISKCILLCAICHRLRHAKAKWKLEMPDGTQ